MEKPTFREALWFWFRLGWISFGGPAGQVAIMHSFLVEKKKWISESRFIHALNYCMLLPGPEAQQLVTYTGWLLHGIRGGLVAGILFILPSMFILLALSVAYVLYGKIAWVAALFDGLKPAVVAIVALALMKIGKKSLLSPFHYLVAIGAFVAIFFLQVPFPLIILSAILLALLLGKYFPGVLASGKHSSNGHPTTDESGYYLSKHSGVVKGHWPLWKIVLMLGCFLVLWFLPFLLLYMGENGPFWKPFIWFFTKAALVTFGGAYAVLPYVAQVSVEKFHWLSSMEMLDGLALGETTPGPLIMVLAFVGFMAAWNLLGNSLMMAGMGLLVTVYYTFLPCFMFVFAGAPFIEKTRDNPLIKKTLGIVTAAVVGVVLNLSVYLLISVVFTQGKPGTSVQWFDVCWILISFFVLYKNKAGMIWWLLISGVAGIAWYFLTK
ncbi:MAG: chromate efflux transporter [Chitinophagaceae bacterium]|nr:chromate efflux transporter [Chitinophagaceae bacterium]